MEDKGNKKKKITIVDDRSEESSRIRPSDDRDEGRKSKSILSVTKNSPSTLTFNTDSNAGDSEPESLSKSKHIGSMKSVDESEDSRDKEIFNYLGERIASATREMQSRSQLGDNVSQSVDFQNDSLPDSYEGTVADVLNGSNLGDERTSANKVIRNDINFVDKISTTRADIQNDNLRTISTNASEDIQSQSYLVANNGSESEDTEMKSSLEGSYAGTNENTQRSYVQSSNASENVDIQSANTLDQYNEDIQRRYIDYSNASESADIQSGSNLGQYNASDGRDVQRGGFFGRSNANKGIRITKYFGSNVENEGNVQSTRHSTETNVRKFQDIQNRNYLKDNNATERIDAEMARYVNENIARKIKDVDNSSYVEGSIVSLSENFDTASDFEENDVNKSVGRSTLSESIAKIKRKFDSRERSINKVKEKESDLYAADNEASRVVDTDDVSTLARSQTNKSEEMSSSCYLSENKSKDTAISLGESLNKEEEASKSNKSLVTSELVPSLSGKREDNVQRGIKTTSKVEGSTRQVTVMSEPNVPNTKSLKRETYSSSEISESSEGDETPMSPASELTEGCSEMSRTFSDQKSTLIRSLVFPGKSGDNVVYDEKAKDKGSDQVDQDKRRAFMATDSNERRSLIMRSLKSCTLSSRDIDSETKSCSEGAEYGLEKSRTSGIIPTQPSMIMRMEVDPKQSSRSSKTARSTSVERRRSVVNTDHRKDVVVEGGALPAGVGLTEPHYPETKESKVQSPTNRPSSSSRRTVADSKPEHATEPSAYKPKEQSKVVSPTVVRDPKSVDRSSMERGERKSESPELKSRPGSQPPVKASSQVTDEPRADTAPESQEISKVSPPSRRPSLLRYYSGLKPQEAPGKDKESKDSSQESMEGKGAKISHTPRTSLLLRNQGGMKPREKSEDRRPSTAGQVDRQSLLLRNVSGMKSREDGSMKKARRESQDSEKRPSTTPSSRRPSLLLWNQTGALQEGKEETKAQNAELGKLRKEGDTPLKKAKDERKGSFTERNRGLSLVKEEGERNFDKRDEKKKEDLKGSDSVRRNSLLLRYQTSETKEFGTNNPKGKAPDRTAIEKEERKDILQHRPSHGGIKSDSESSSENKTSSDS